jgi:hypothetical protein
MVIKCVVFLNIYINNKRLNYLLLQYFSVALNSQAMKKITKCPAAICCMFLLGIFTLVSCGQSAEKTGEKMLEKTLEQSTGEKTDVDIEEGNFTIESENMKANIKEANTWPSEAPSDVPTFTWGDINHTTTSETEGIKSWGVHLKNVPLDALGKYESELKKAGFKTTKFTMNEGGNVTAEKGKLIVTATVGDGNGHVGIQLLP